MAQVGNITSLQPQWFSDDNAVWYLLYAESQGPVPSSTYIHWLYIMVHHYLTHIAADDR